MGEANGYLQVFSIPDSVITHTQHFLGIAFSDTLPITGGTEFLIAGDMGLLKTTWDLVLEHYFQEYYITSLCHVSGSRYLVGIYNYGLILWNELTD